MNFKATQTFVGLSLFFSITALAADPVDPVVLLHETYSTGVGGNATVQGALNKVLDAQAKNLADLQALKTTLSDERAVTTALHQTADALTANTDAMKKVDDDVYLANAKKDWISAQEQRIRDRLGSELSDDAVKRRLSIADANISSAEKTIRNMTSELELERFQNGFVGRSGISSGISSGVSFRDLSDDSLRVTRSSGGGYQMSLDLPKVVASQKKNLEATITAANRQKELLEVEAKRLSAYRYDLRQPIEALNKVNTELEKAETALIEKANKFQTTLKDGKRLEKTVVIKLSKEEEALLRAEKEGVVGESLMAKILKARGIGTGMAVVGIAATGYFIYESAQAKETQWVSTDASAKLKHVSQGPALLDESPLAIGHSAKSDLL